MRIEVVIFDGFDELDVFGPVEVLSMASTPNRPFDVELVGVHGPGEVIGQHGTRVRVTARLAGGGVDAVIVPGGGWLNRAPAGAWAQLQEAVLPRRLAELAPSLRWTASVCTGAMLLAAAGLLEARPATTNRRARGELAQAGAVVLTNRVVDDGNVITAGGLSAGLDLGLWILEREVGPELAAEVADRMEYTAHRDVHRTASR